MPLSKTLYHTCFICGQRCKCWSRLPKLTSSVISDVKPIIYIFDIFDSLSVPRVKTYQDAIAFHSCAPSFRNNLLVPVHSAISVSTFKKHLKTHLFDMAFAPQIPACPIACWCYGIVCNFAVGHWFGFHTTEPGLAGDIGAIEVWFIDWLIDKVIWYDIISTTKPTERWINAFYNDRWLP